MADRIN